MNPPNQFHLRDVLSNLMVGVLTLGATVIFLWHVAVLDVSRSIEWIQQAQPWILVPLAFVVAFTVGVMFPGGTHLLRWIPGEEYGLTVLRRLLKGARILGEGQETIYAPYCHGTRAGFQSKKAHSITAPLLRARVAALAGVEQKQLIADMTDREHAELFDLCVAHVMRQSSSLAQLNIERTSVFVNFNVRIGLLFFLLFLMFGVLGLLGGTFYIGVGLAGKLPWAATWVVAAVFYLLALNCLKRAQRQYALYHLLVFNDIMVDSGIRI